MYSIIPGLKLNVVILTGILTADEFELQTIFYCIQILSIKSKHINVLS